MRAPFAALAASLLACSCSTTPHETGPSGPPCAVPRFADGRTSVQCQQMVDAEGRVIFFHGVNARVQGVFDVSFDDGRLPLEPIPAFTAADAARMRAVGFNALRLPMQWSALEPEEHGGFVESYLDAVEAAVTLADQAGLRVLIDLHQDAYSKEIGEDGAPLWAIDPPPTELLGGPLTDLGTRRTSNQVQAAFSTFFSSAAALRARFTAAAVHVAQRFQGNAAVLGIELYNEPLPDTQTQLDDLHDEMISALHQADPGLIALFEPNALRNLENFAPLAGRAPWPGTAYAPHVYTLAFDGDPEDQMAMTEATLAPSNQSAQTEAASWDAPLVITEFGYDPNGIQADSYVEWEEDLQDSVQASAFYWVWKEESQGFWGMFDYDATADTWSERVHTRQALARVAVEAVSGWPTTFGYDRTSKVFHLGFTGDPALTAPCLIFVPEAEDFAPSFTVTCDGAAVDAARDPATGLISVACGGPGTHTVVLTGS